MMPEHEKVNILLVDDQPSKLLSYEVILHDLGENLIKASSGREALEHLLKSEIAVVLVDVCMPDLDGFQLAAMIREHPRFQKTAMIFISAIHLTDMDRLRGYEMGAVDYVPVPVIPEVLRAKVKVFAELYRKTRQLERVNAELEGRVFARTAELEASTKQLRQSEERRSLALVAGNMGSWDWNQETGECLWDDGQYRIFGVDRGHFAVSAENVRALVHPDDWSQLQDAVQRLLKDRQPTQAEFRVKRPNGEVRWCHRERRAKSRPDRKGSADQRRDGRHHRSQAGRRASDAARPGGRSSRQERARRRAIDCPADPCAHHRRLHCRGGRPHPRAFAGTYHSVAVALAGRRSARPGRRGTGALSQRATYPRIEASGPHVSLRPAAAQCLALALHELVTNAAKYGALSAAAGRVEMKWSLASGNLDLHWTEHGGPETEAPTAPGFGTRIIKASIEGQLGGQTAFEWATEGVRCYLSVPLGNGVSSHTSGNGQHAPLNQTAPVQRPIAVLGNRVLVVEDEALVAMAIRESLDTLGYSVVGPCSKITEAVVALRHNRVDAAVLDINLGGESGVSAGGYPRCREHPLHLRYRLWRRRARQPICRSPDPAKADRAQRPASRADARHPPDASAARPDCLARDALRRDHPRLCSGRTPVSRFGATLIQRCDRCGILFAANGFAGPEQPGQRPAMALASIHLPQRHACIGNGPTDTPSMRAADGPRGCLPASRNSRGWHTASAASS